MIGAQNWMMQDGPSLTPRPYLPPFVAQILDLELKSVGFARIAFADMPKVIG